MNEAPDASNRCQEGLIFNIFNSLSREREMQRITSGGWIFVCVMGLAFGASAGKSATPDKPGRSAKCRPGLVKINPGTRSERCVGTGLILPGRRCKPGQRAIRVGGRVRCVGTGVRPQEGRCREGEKLIFAGTRSERCIPASNHQTCKTGERRACRLGLFGLRTCRCVKPGGGGLCPNGFEWKNTCPPNARCIIGGRCVPTSGGPNVNRCPAGMKWEATRCPPNARCMPGRCVREPVKPGGSPTKVCPEGSRLQPVMCIRAPCPQLCLPIR
jgi:hypothetical protein